MTIKLKKWDVVEHLKFEEDMMSYFDVCLAENDPTLIAAALGDVARARVMSQVPKDTDVPQGSVSSLTSHTDQGQVSH